MSGQVYLYFFEMLWKHAYALLFWQFFLVHDKPKLNCFAIFFFG